jgi:WD40 repeat protein
MAPRRRGGAQGGRDAAVRKNDAGLALAVLSRAAGGGARRLHLGSSSFYAHGNADEALLRRLKPSGPVLDASAGGDDDDGVVRRFPSSSSSPPTIAMAFSPLGATLATASSEDVGRIRLWDAASRRPRRDGEHVVEVVSKARKRRRARKEKEDERWLFSFSFRSLAR